MSARRRKRHRRSRAWPPARPGHLPNLGLAILSGVLLALAFPPLHLLLPPFVALVPLLIYLDRAEDRRSAFWGAWYGGLTFYVLLLYWFFHLLRFTLLIVLGYIISIGILAAFFALTALAIRQTTLRLRLPYVLAAPAIWIVIEHLRSLGDLGFTWGELAYTLTGYPVLLQGAELGGPYAISAWLVVMNVLLFYVIRGPRRPLAIVGLLLGVLLPTAYGLDRMTALAWDRTFRVALVQPNVPQEVKFDPETRSGQVGTLTRLSRQGVVEGAELIIWPETAIPTYLRRTGRVRAHLLELTREWDRSILLGSLDYTASEEGAYQLFNAAFLADPGGFSDQVFHKVRLVPITEKVPFQDVLGFLERVSRWVGTFSSGREYMVWPVGPAQVGPMICFESIFPSVSRALRRQGANVAVDITNDAWFGRSAAPYQHFSFLVLRAIETRMSHLQAANTGLSGLVDPLGRIVARTGLNEEAVLTVDAPLVEGQTPYTRFGDLVVWAAWGLLVFWGGGAEILRGQA